MKRINLFMGGIFTAVGVVFMVVGVLTALLLRVPLLLLFTLFGLPFLLIGVGFLRRNAYEKQDKAWLQENGSKIYADFVAVQYNTTVWVNGRCPLVIQCQAVNPADRKVYVFESEISGSTPNRFYRTGRRSRCWWTATTTTGIWYSPTASCPSRDERKKTDKLWINWESMM